MEYELGKMLEEIDRKLNLVLVKLYPEAREKPKNE